MEESARVVRDSATVLATLSEAQRNAAIDAIAQALEDNADVIVAANEDDVKAAAEGDVAQALQGRLKLDHIKLEGAIQGVRKMKDLPDPLGRVDLHRELDEGLVLQRVACPLGVIGIIFEARPDALIQIVSLAIKSGNGVILKGGKEANGSNNALVTAIHSALEGTDVPKEVVLLLTTRGEIQDLLKCERYVDLIIPRGGNALVKYVQENTRIPVIGHSDGLCHLFVDKEADMKKAVAIAVDSKTHYPSACNTIETLLVHQDAAGEYLPLVVPALIEHNVELRGCERTREVVPMKEATADDWSAEYCDLVLAIKIVSSVEDAEQHISTYGSKHTECIVTRNAATAQAFQLRVDAAGVFHNCSTRFADGFRYGFGAEVGISTQKMPPRGPVGLEGLITYKYVAKGDGHIAADYSGKDAKPFTHRDL